ncbi:RIP-like protein [Glossina fuscipes]|uniref:RIP-like protein n=2 Tax=Nemorhina TaxID=44051 RepID=A0A8U0W9J5_9MUSC|nr:RIP-like protein [Glossina fuscipes]KAI9586710.1 hypothetical protein GQX74_002557 [Glossina fuscipes]
MDCLTSPSSPKYNTTIEQKLKAQRAAKLYRRSSPKLRDLLREKCRIRLKEARHISHSRMRSINEEDEEHVPLKDLLRQEISELDFDINLQEEIYNELIEEINEWFVEQQEGEDNYYVEVDETNALICPVCQKSTLVIYLNKDNRYNYRCKCSANFFFKEGPQVLQSLLSDEIDKHEQLCSKRLIFFVNPLTQQLEIICETCDYFSC